MIYIYIFDNCLYLTKSILSLFFIAFINIIHMKDFSKIKSSDIIFINSVLEF